ncbi:MAG TPA: hypothetical protein DCK99_00445 [Blastocatellia bacterium]|nr:hypothetical protein [Blastocatellia bacterium]
MNQSKLLLRALLFSGVFLFLANATTHAGSATWNLNPTSGDWNTAANWTPATVPNGPTDTATFAVSDTTAISLSASTEVNAIVFDPGASAFTITDSASPLLTISGAGITNNSGIAQNFVSVSSYPIGSISFHNEATAGNDTFFTVLVGIDTAGGGVDFYDNSNAGTATFTNQGGDGSDDGLTFFFDRSSAAEGTFINNGTPGEGGQGGGTVFFDGTTAGDATIISDGGISPGLGGGFVEFSNDSDAGNATIIAKGGTGANTEGGVTIFFGGNPGNATLIALGGTDGGGGGSILFESATHPGTARVELFGNGSLEIVGAAMAVEVGSIEGDGDVRLGGSRLTVGQNNLSTVFSGMIAGAGNNHGSLTKKGTGSLMLTNANTYTGGTTVSGGRLVVNNIGGSGTGSGAVRVSAGILAGRGTIAGEVTIGTGSGAGAALAPGRRGRKTDTLTIQDALTFQFDSTYDFELKTTSGTADKVVANGVIINSGALFSFNDLGSGTLPQGIVFTAIDNTAASPIAGTFSNVADGSTFTVGSNTFQASYEGGDGNDLTLTVLP